MTVYESRVELSPRPFEAPEDVDPPDNLAVDVDVTVSTMSETGQEDIEPIALAMASGAEDALYQKLRELGHTDSGGGSA